MQQWAIGSIGDQKIYAIFPKILFIIRGENNIAIFRDMQYVCTCLQSKSQPIFFLTK
jgi:hypothetical protein